jgi:hypothetical protein
MQRLGLEPGTLRLQTVGSTAAPGPPFHWVYLKLSKKNIGRKPPSGPLQTLGLEVPVALAKTRSSVCLPNILNSFIPHGSQIWFVIPHLSIQHVSDRSLVIM